MDFAYISLFPHIFSLVFPYFAPFWAGPKWGKIGTTQGRIICNQYIIFSEIAIISFSCGDISEFLMVRD